MLLYNCIVSISWILTNVAAILTQLISEINMLLSSSTPYRSNRYNKTKSMSVFTVNMEAIKQLKLNLSQTTNIHNKLRGSGIPQLHWQMHTADEICI